MNCCSLGINSSLQFSQIFRTSRWATMASSVAVSRNGSMPRSSSRAIELGASFVCSVENTRCPVSDACTEICAVSRSRISPDQDDVRVLPQEAPQAARERKSNVRLDLALDQPVNVVLDRVLAGEDLHLGACSASCSAEYSVVVFPEPVGPVTMMMPCGLAIS